ncbi:MAG: tetratricopeptide repeat protein, partial [Aureliella sp.]
NELASVPGLQPLREQLLESALQFYADLTERDGGNEFSLETARAFQRIAAIRRELEQSDAARQANTQSIALFEKIRTVKPNDQAVLLGLATTLLQAGRPVEVVQLCQQIIEFDDKNPTALELLAALAQGERTRAAQRFRRS